jgi:broad specificity phosphatase PhoE
MSDHVTLCLIRHGDTAWSLTGQHTSHTELALTVHGAAQARALAPRLAGMGLSQVWVSPRLRARQTCDLAGLGARRTAMADLAEWDYGTYEGRTSHDIALERPDWNMWEHGCPGGETPADVSARADRVIAGVRSLRGTVALFSHGHFGPALAMRWLGLPVHHGQHFPLHTATISLLSEANHHPGRRTLSAWNDSGAQAQAAQDHSGSSSSSLSSSRSTNEAAKLASTVAPTR